MDLLSERVSDQEHGGRVCSVFPPEPGVYSPDRFPATTDNITKQTPNRLRQAARTTPILSYSTANREQLIETSILSGSLL